MSLLFSLLITLSNFEGATSNTSNVSKECPTWTYRQDKHCKCGHYLHDVVICDNETMTVQLMKCYCITFSDTTNVEVVGNCVLTCGLSSSIRTYYTVPRDASTVEDYTCRRYNRHGQMCSKCNPEHGVSVYPYSYYCTKNRYHWIKYIAITYLPLTLLYIIILIVNLDTTRTVLSFYILFSQIITAPIMAKLYDFQSRGSISISVFTAIYGIWNLDFGRFIYEPFCLHPSLSTHHVIALDYLIAVYPLLLILLTYILVKLHDNYRLVVLICKPFYCCIRRIQKEWNIKASLIDVFATFILLSNVKLLNVSFDLISVPVTLKNITGHRLPQQYTYTNGSMEYLGKEHWPYFALGVIVIMVSNVLPILLFCFYPFRWFQRCLNCCSLSSPSIHIFMDAFQGCYKTTPRDYRCLSALNFIFRHANFLIFYLTINQSYFTLLGLLSTVMLFFTMLIQPYKSNDLTYFEGLIYLNIALIGFVLSTSKEQIHVSEEYKRFYFFLKFLLLAFPTLVIAVWIVYLFLTKSMLNKKVATPILKFLYRCKAQQAAEENPLLMTVD